MKQNKPKIVFFGTPDFAVASLDALITSGADIAAVVTTPDKPAGRGHKMLHSAVKEYALVHDLPLLQPEKLKAPEFIDALRQINADLFIVIAFRMLPESVWAMPPLGTFNLHASLLPRYRGAAPINHAVMNGDSVTGVTTFFLKHEIDTGDIIDRESIEIGPDENVGSVHDRLMALGATLTLRTVRAIEEGTLKTTPQDELYDVYAPCPAPKIFKDDCRIDWQRPARELHNFIRGLSPYPAAWTELIAGKDTSLGTLKILEARPLEQAPALNPGEIRIDGPQMLIGTGCGALEVLRLQGAGKKAMDTASFLRGLRADCHALSCL